MIEEKKCGCKDWFYYYTFPVRDTKMECTSCGKEREPNKNEWKHILLNYTRRA